MVAALTVLLQMMLAMPMPMNDDRFLSSSISLHLKEVDYWLCKCTVESVVQLAASMACPWPFEVEVLMLMVVVAATHAVESSSSSVAWRAEPSYAAVL